MFIFENKRKIIEEVFSSWSGLSVEKIIPLPKSGSDREYYRVSAGKHSAICVINHDRKENRAFLYFGRHFYKSGLPVPRIYAENRNGTVYIIEDLGDVTLFDLLEQDKKTGTVSNRTIGYYKKTLEYLIEFQTVNPAPDYNYCYPRSDFDRQSMLWDLNYFKYYFLKLSGVSFDEQKLENDFNAFIDFLLDTGTDYFMYRDFQARNIMIKENNLYFIDFQGGRRGALQYDVASILFQTKANLPEKLRTELLRHYLFILSQKINISEEKFMKYFYEYGLIRLLQTMGAYGYRGFYERKDHFLNSIPYAINILNYILSKSKVLPDFKELSSVLSQIPESDKLKDLNNAPSSDKLKITVRSFSYKSGIPYDASGNGGGFVFDCRALLNPGRFVEYKKLTGRDKEVIEFLEKKSGVKEYLKNVFAIIDKSISNYQERKFSDLMINFGCTGGQHRSVYCAEAAAKHIRRNFDCEIDLKHIELDNE